MRAIETRFYRANAHRGHHKHGRRAKKAIHLRYLTERTGKRYRKRVMAGPLE